MLFLQKESYLDFGAGEAILEDVCLSDWINSMADNNSAHIKERLSSDVRMYDCVREIMTKRYPKMKITDIQQSCTPYKD